jgi:hypothetical protein
VEIGANSGNVGRQILRSPLIDDLLIITFEVVITEVIVLAVRNSRVAAISLLLNPLVWQVFEGHCFSLTASHSFH